MEENNTKEINLLQLINLLGEWIKKKLRNLLRAIGYFMRLSYRQIIPLIIIIVVFIAGGQFLARKSARQFKAEAMVMINGGEAQTVRQICRQLENSLESNKMISLSTKLSIPDSLTKNIIGIKSFYVIDYMRDSVADVIDFKDAHSLEDTMNIRMKDRIYLQVITLNIKQLPVIQNAILSYLNKNQTLKTQYEVKKAGLLEEIEICNRESKRIDSLAKVSYYKDNYPQLRFNNDKLIVGEQSKQLFYGELLRLHQLKLKAEVELSGYTQPVSMPSGLVVNPFPLNGRIKYGIFSILIGYFIGILLIAFVENRKKVMDYLKK